MEVLPDEIILNIISLLDVPDIVCCQRTSSRFLRLCRDQTIWKQACFEESRAEGRRRRQWQGSSNAQLAALRSAFTDWTGRPYLDENRSQPDQPPNQVRTRAWANWDPSYPTERPDYYEEYIHRHAPISVGWFRIPPTDNGEFIGPNEATGVGVLRNTEAKAPEHVVAPLDDGSVCIWNVQSRETGQPPTQGHLVGRSAMGLLSMNKSKHTSTDIRAMMTETGAVESVSIDDWKKRGYFAYDNALVEVDLATLQVISHEEYPFPVTALSQIHNHSLVVGTNHTIHMHDPRKQSKQSVDPNLTVELIGGPTSSHATLSQPGPLSILNREEDDSIWVAGRFTHMLNYDRRYFPRLRGTVHSGARISCIATLNYPFRPHEMDLLQDPSLSIQELQSTKSAPGSTLLVAGEYKGKGSLEYYNLTPSPSGPRTTHGYQNRQSASSTKLLSVASHGLSTVFSDGNGNIRWVERDGSTPIRRYNINEEMPPPSFNQAQSLAQDLSRSEDSNEGDIVQKMIPLSHSQASSYSSKRVDSNQSDLLLKTGDGKIGILGFGHDSLYAREEAEAIVETLEERIKRDAERSYQESMGRLLKRHADEAILFRFRGMGLRPPS